MWYYLSGVRNIGRVLFFHVSGESPQGIVFVVGQFWGERSGEFEMGGKRDKHLLVNNFAGSMFASHSMKISIVLVLPILCSTFY